MKTLVWDSDAARAQLTLEDLDRADEAAIAWTRAFGKRPLLDGKSFRELFRWKDVSLWWFAELYLHHSTAATRYVRWIDMFHATLAREAPDEVVAQGLSVEEALLLARCCTARGVLFQDPPRPPLRRLRWRATRRRLQSRWNEIKTLAAALKATIARPTLADRAGPARALFLSHAAFWKDRATELGAIEEYEHYFDRLIPETEKRGTLKPWVVAVGPRAAFRRRGKAERLRDWLSLAERGPFEHINRHVSFGVLSATLGIGSEMRRAWQTLRVSPALAELFSHRGVRFDDLALPDLAGTLLLQVPWAVRSYEEMARALAATHPAIAVLYAESSGWGRAAVAACRAARVPTLGIQHGILYPTYYSYRHDPDEADCPRPDRTAVFGEAARRFLIQSGHYAPESLVITGSPKFDELVEAARGWDRDAKRKRLGISPDERLVVVASRHRGIRETHQSIGSAFPSLLKASAALPRIRLLIKPHPAESTDGYAKDIRACGATHATLLQGSADLAELLFAADLLVTVESLSAVEALVLGRPVVILNMPTNLREMVDAGVAIGVAAGEDPSSAVRAALDDPGVRERLRAARERYLADVASGVDGRATARILDLMQQTAQKRPLPGA